MNTLNSINSIALGKLFKRYKLISKGKQEITKATNKRYLIWPRLNSLSRQLDKYK